MPSTLYGDVAGAEVGGGSRPNRAATPAKEGVAKYCDSSLHLLFTCKKYIIIYITLRNSVSNSDLSTKDAEVPSCDVGWAAGGGSTRSGEAGERGTDLERILLLIADRIPGVLPLSSAMSPRIGFAGI